MAIIKIQDYDEMYSDQFELRASLEELLESTTMYDIVRVLELIDPIELIWAINSGVGNDS